MKDGFRGSLDEVLDLIQQKKVIRVLVENSGGEVHYAIEVSKEQAREFAGRVAAMGTDDLIYRKRTGVLCLFTRPKREEKPHAN